MESKSIAGMPVIPQMANAGEYSLLAGPDTSNMIASQRFELAPPSGTAVVSEAV